MLKQVVVGIVSLAWSASVGAETITVCLDGSCDYVHIQEAIDAAADGDVIQIGPGDYFQWGWGSVPTIDTKGLQITIEGAVSGDGTLLTHVRNDLPLVDSSPTIVMDTVSSSVPVFRNLVIHRTNYLSGVYLSQCAAHFDNCSFALANGVNYQYGRYVTVQGGELRCSNCRFSGGYSDIGSAIYSEDGVLQLDTTVFASNQALLVDHIAAVFVSGGSVSATNCIFQDNSAGAIFLDSCESQIQGCSFEGNSVPWSKALPGGAITQIDGTLAIANSAFQCNECLPGSGVSGSDGGAISVRGGDLSVANCDFHDNYSGGFGGAVALRNASANVVDSTFLGNQCVLDGGAIYSRTTDIDITGSSILANSALNIGGVYLLSSQAVIGSTAICGNGGGDILGAWDDAGGNTIADGCPGSIVTVCADGCDFQDVSEAVNSAPGFATIQLFAETYLLSRTINPAGKSITIRGTVDPTDGAPTSVLDAQGQFRVLLCNSGEQTGTTFENLVIQNGLGTLECSPVSGWELGGGGLFVNSSPTLLNCAFLSNRAQRGGGLFLHDQSSPVLTDCRFDLNEATVYGGGLYVRDGGSPQLVDCELVQNIAVFGGGVYLYASTPDFTSCSFQLNHASGVFGGGGGLYANESQAVVSDCMFRANTAPGTPDDPDDGSSAGGAVFSLVSHIDFTQTTFTENSSQYGGAVWNERGSGGLFDQCVFSSNAAQLYGGGCANDESSDPMLIGCSFLGNTADVGGAVLNINGSSPVHDTCAFTNNQARFGGAMASFSSAPQSSDCSFTSNSAEFAGALYLNDSSGSQFIDCLVSGNSAEYGGGAFHYSSAATYSGCTFEGNTAEFAGGALQNVEQSNPVFLGCQMQFNAAPSGGALFNVSSVPELNSSTICANGIDQISGSWLDTGFNCIEVLCSDCPDQCPDWPYACSDDGRVLYVPAGAPTGTVQLAIDFVPSGGQVELAVGIFLTDSPLDPGGKMFELIGAVDVDGNPLSILDAGGGHRVVQCDSGEGATTRFVNLVIRGGSAPDGAGVLVNASSPVFENCVLTANRATNSGGAVYSLLGSPLLVGCSVTDNSAVVSGGGLFALLGAPALDETTVCGNLPDQVAGDWAGTEGSCIAESCLACSEDACPADIDGDGQVGGVDLGFMLGYWGCSGTDCTGDLNSDGSVDGADLTIILAAWGPCDL